MIDKVALHLKVVEPTKWYLPAKYQLMDDYTIAGITVPRGTVTDGVTISRWFTGLGLVFIALGHASWPWLFAIGVFCISLPLLFPRTGQAMGAAVLHDYLLTISNRRYADQKFKDALISLNIKQWRVWLMYNGVRLYSFAKQAIKVVDNFGKKSAR